MACRQRLICGSLAKYFGVADLLRLHIFFNERGQSILPSCHGKSKKIVFILLGFPPRETYLVRMPI